MRRKKLRFVEDAAAWDNLENEGTWPELRSALRQPANSQDLGLWRLAEDSDRLARRRATLVRLTPCSEPRLPDFPDAA